MSLCNCKFIRALFINKALKEESTKPLSFEASTRHSEEKNYSKFVKILEFFQLEKAESFMQQLHQEPSGMSEFLESLKEDKSWEQKTKKL